MYCGEDCSLSVTVFCVVSLPFILQTVGLFSPNWISNSNCDRIGLVYSCCTGENNNTCENTKGGDELDVRVLGLEATSFTVMFLAVTGAIFGAWFQFCYNEEEEYSILPPIMGCCIVLLVIAGLFSFIGCMIIVGSYSASQFGWSFYLCLVSGCFIFLVMFFICLMGFIDKKKNEKMPTAGALT